MKSEIAYPSTPKKEYDWKKGRFYIINHRGEVVYIKPDKKKKK